MQLKELHAKMDKILQLLEGHQIKFIGGDSKNELKEGIEDEDDSEDSV
jgi:hypothetical protein